MGAGASTSPKLSSLREKTEKLFKCICKKKVQSFDREDLVHFLRQKCGINKRRAMAQSVSIMSSANAHNGVVTLPSFVALCSRVGVKVGGPVIDYVLNVCEYKYRAKRKADKYDTTRQTVASFLQMLTTTKSVRVRRTRGTRSARIRGLVATESVWEASISFQKKLVDMFTEGVQLLSNFEKTNPPKQLCRKGHVLGKSTLIQLKDQTCGNCSCELIFQQTLVQSCPKCRPNVHFCLPCIFRRKKDQSEAARLVFMGKDLNEAHDIQATVIAACWFLIRVLCYAHCSKPLKTIVRMLFSNQRFTNKLVIFDGTTLLRNGIQLLLVPECTVLRNLYEKEQLFRRLGSYKPSRIVGHTGRQDFGLPHPPGFDWVDQSQEEIYIHFLRLIAYGIDLQFQRKVKACVEPFNTDERPFHNSGIRSIKSFSKMLRNMVSPFGHRVASKPRPAMNDDINRCSVAVKNWQGVIGVMKALRKGFGGSFVRVNNEMRMVSAEAAKQQHVRVVTASVEFDTGGTFAQLCANPIAVARWMQYSDQTAPATVAGTRWSSQIDAALKCIRSEELAHEPVRMVCEVQCILSSYRDLRCKISERVKVLHAIEQESPHQSFKNIFTNIKQKVQFTDDGKDKTLHYCRDDKAQLLRRIFENNMTVDDMNQHFKVACRYGSTEVLKVLMKQPGARMIVRSQMYELSRLVITGQRKPRERVNAMQMLLHAKAHVDDAKKGVTALCMAADLGNLPIVRLLVKAKANVNAAYGRNTVLYTAAMNGYSEIVCCLLKARARVNATRTADRTTSIYAAAKAGHFDVVKHLVRFNADIHAIKSTDGTHALYIAAEKGFFDVVCHLSRSKADVDRAGTGTGATPLWTAASNGHTSVVRFLVKANAAIDITRKGTEMTALCVAANNRHVRTVRLLLKAKADVNKGNALYEAAKSGSTAVVSLLLGAKATLESLSANPLANPLARSSLWIASSNGHADAVHYLVEAKANVSSNITNNGSSCLWIASSNGHPKVARILVRARADVNETRMNDKTTALYVASQGGHSEVVRFLLEAKAHVNMMRSDNGTTGLWMAACRGHVDIVRILVEAKANVDVARSDDRITGFWIASQNDHIDVVRFLLQVQANINVVRHSDKTTALHLAAFGGNLELVRMLSSAKANVNMTSNFGTALNMATRAKHDDIVAYLTPKKRRKKRKRRKKKNRISSKSTTRMKSTTK